MGDLAPDPEGLRTHNHRPDPRAGQGGQWVDVYPKADGVDCGNIRTDLPHFRSKCSVRFTRHIGVETDRGWLEFKSRKDGDWSFVGLWPE